MSNETIFEGLNSAQHEAVAHTDGPLLIVAGAGTGKTTVLTRRFERLALNTEGSAPDRVLALTFTEKAAGEMEDRILSRLPMGTYDLWISTFHGFCQRILEAHALDIGLPNQFRLLTTTDAWLLMRRRFAELPLEYYRPLGNPMKFLRSLLSHISRAKDEGVRPETYRAFAQSHELTGTEEEQASERARLLELANVYTAYRDILLEEGCLDFGDLILETLRLFRERPAVLAQYQEQFRYVLVDEFQDTNGAQYELVKLLCAKHNNLTVVGDDDQAIYKFRGASLANILQFRDDFPQAKTVALIENYRSNAEILNCAYAFIKHNDPHRLESRLGISKELIAARGEGGIVEAQWYGSIEEEAQTVAESIRERKANNPELSWNDMAILVRSNDGAEPFLRALEHQGVPYQFVALRGLYAKPIIVDIMAFLALLDGQHESAPVWRVLSMPSYAVGQKDRAELLHLANRKGVSLWHALTAVVRNQKGFYGELSVEGRNYLEKLLTDVEGLSLQAQREAPLRVLQKFLEVSGLLAQTVRLEEREKRESLSHLNAFAQRITRYEAAVRAPSMHGFLEELRLEIDSGEEGALTTDPDHGPELVKVLTIHASKGLEFKHVYVVSLVDQRFPARGRPEAIPLPHGLVSERLEEGDHHIEEERRLMYVALTRAKDTLTVTGASRYGGTREKKPSSFWGEAGFPAPSAQAINVDHERLLRVPQTLEALEEVQEKELFPLKRRFSFTQLAAFRKCPMQYKFAHVYRIPVLGAFQKTFGQSMHLVFQRMLELHKSRLSAKQGSLFGAPETTPTWSGNGIRVTDDEAYQIFQDAWKDEWYTDRKQHDEYYAKGEGAMRNMLRAYKDECPTIGELEKDFTLVLGQHSLKGKIDRIDIMPDGSVMVIDYKTGKAKDTLATEDKEQLYLYQIALEERGLKVCGMRYVHVLDWEYRDVEPLTEKKRAAFLEKLEERMDELLRSDYPPTPDPFVCRTCDFREICEFRKMH